jgi:DNA-binding GntR family transcriptional regulator
MDRPQRLDARARRELAAERHRHRAALEDIPASDGPAAAAEVNRHLGRVTQIMEALARRLAHPTWPPPKIEPQKDGPAV